MVVWTPFKRDPRKDLADECQRQGLKLFFYDSQLDCHDPDLLAPGPDRTEDRPTGARALDARNVPTARPS